MGPAPSGQHQPIDRGVHRAHHRPATRSTWAHVINADTRDGHSDYGNAFVSFTENFHNVLSPRSSLLVLGDGRTNYRNPAVDVLAHMVTASRHAHWLNPEPRHLWGSGDSAVPRYEDVITMHECRSAKQLAAVIDQLLPV